MLASVPFVLVLFFSCLATALPSLEYPDHRIATAGNDRQGHRVPPNPPPLTVSPSTTDQELRALRLHVSPATPTSISIHFLHADCIL